MRLISPLSCPCILSLDFSRFIFATSEGVFMRRYRVCFRKPVVLVSRGKNAEIIMLNGWEMGMEMPADYDYTSNISTVSA